MGVNTKFVLLQCVVTKIWAIEVSDIALGGHLEKVLSRSRILEDFLLCFKGHLRHSKPLKNRLLQFFFM